MSGEYIVHERRRSGPDDRDEFADQHDGDDGGSVRPRQAFERPRSWTDGEAGVGSPSGMGAGDGGEDAAEGGGGDYGQRFFSEVLAPCRSAYVSLLARATILTLALTWACLPIYWGSLSAAADLTGNLEAWVLNRDHARFGDSLAAAVLAAPTSGPGSLWWRLINASHFPDEQAVIRAVVNERTWLAIVVNANATNNLNQARAVGNASYDPLSAITVYYAQARNEAAIGTFLLPAATHFLSNFTTNYATNSAQRFFAASVSQNGTVNQTALSNVARAPQAISPGIGYDLVNVCPYTTSIAQAVLLVGQIYICIFALIIVMAHSTARARIEQYLTFPSYLTLRIVTPLVLYFPLSLSYALVSLAFRLPFGTHFSYGAGFLAFFGFTYLGMASLGLALEAMITILKPKFVPFFLVLLIIVNVSTAALPPELQPRLYAYGAGFQFWNIQQALRTILFDTYSHLPKNAGILISWILISCGTTSLFTWLVRYRDVRRAHRAGLGLGVRGRDRRDTENGDGGGASERWEEMKVMNKLKMNKNKNGNKKKGTNPTRPIDSTTTNSKEELKRQNDDERDTTCLVVVEKDGGVDVDVDVDVDVSLKT